MPFSLKDLPADLSERDYKEKFKELTEEDKDFNVNTKDSNSGQPLLISAAERGYINAVKVLLSYQEIDINARDERKRTALHVACERADLRLIKLLLGHRNERASKKTFTADISLIDDKGYTPLKLLPKTDDEYNLHQLLLYQACEIGRLDVFNDLITMGVRLDYPDRNSRTPLHLATDNGHLLIVKRLLDFADDKINKINIEAKLGNNNTALHIAAFKAYPEIVLELILRGARVDAENEDNQTPFMIAFEQPERKPQELVQIIELFKKRSPEKFNIKRDIATRTTTVSKDSYFHIAATNDISPECFAILFESVEQGSDILNACNSRGEAPLHVAVASNCAMIPAFKAKGANLLVKKEQVIVHHGQQIYGATPLHLIFMYQYYSSLEPLFENLTKQQITQLIAAETTNTQARVLHYAAECRGDKNEDINPYLEKLLESLDDTEQELIQDKSADALLNSVDSEGNTPAHIAMIKVSYGNYLALMRKGANIIVSNKKGMTAVHYVVQSGDYATLKETLPTLSKPEIIALFQMKGEKKSSLLHLAANIENKDPEKGYKENVLALLLTYLEAVVDKELFTKLINEQDENLNTPTHIASMRLNIFNYIYLTEAGAKVDIKNKDIQTSAYKIKAHPLYSKMILLREQVKNFKRSLQPNLLTRIYRSVSGVEPVPMRASGGGSPRGRQRSDSKTNLKPLGLRRSSSGGSSGGSSPRDITLTVPTSSQSSSTPASARPLLEEPSSTTGTTPSISLPPSARSQGDVRSENEQQINTLLYGLVDKNKSPSIWGEIKQHFSRNASTYIVIALIAYYVGFFAICALSAFFPPVAAAIPIVAVIGKALGAMHFLHIAAPLINPIAKGITMSLPIIVPQAVSLINYSMGSIAAVVYGLGKGCQYLWSTLTKSNNKFQTEYKPAAELGIVVSTGTSTPVMQPSATKSNPPELKSTSSSSNSGWFKSFEDCFQPFRDFGSSLFGPSLELDEPPPLKRKVSGEKASPPISDQDNNKPSIK